MKFFYSIILTLIGAQVSDAQTTVNLSSDLDNTMYSESIDESNGIGDFLFIGINMDGDTRRALLRFDLTSIPSNATVTSASLTLRCGNSQGTNAVMLHRLLDDWGEGTSHAPHPEGRGGPATPGDATWGYKFHDTASWVTNGGDFTSVISATENVSGSSTTVFSSTGLTADVQSWVDGSNPNYGWLLKGDEAASGRASQLHSRQNTSNPPALSVTYEIIDPCAGVGVDTISGIIPSGMYSLDSSLVSDGSVLADSIVTIEAVNFVELIGEFEVLLHGDLEVQALPCD